MTSKPALLEIICKEFTAAQKGEAEPWIPKKDQLSFPPLLPVGTGKHLDATDALLEAVRAYAKCIRDNSSALRSAFSVKEFSALVRLAFGRTLDSIGSAEPQPEELGPAVESAIQAEIDATLHSIKLLVGCWLFQDESAYPIDVGPVHFDLRLNWLEGQKASGQVSALTYRRLKRAWLGEKIRARKKTSDEHRESAIFEAVDRCPVVCQIETRGLSSDLVVTKGLLAARLAMSALALLWGNPSSAMEHMNLIYDGERFRRKYATIYETGGFGSGTSWVHLPRGQDSKDPLKPFIDEFLPTLNLVGAALEAYVNPHAPPARPGILNAVFLSLWWFHEGCREESDQMAVTAFAASLDALAAGRKAAGIKKLLEVRLGFKSGDALMKDGQTVNSVIGRVYDAARSRFIHGSSTDFAEDWSNLRGTAQAVSRLLLVQLTYWLHMNTDVTDMIEMQS